MQNGRASQKVFQGLEPFQPLTTMAVQMQSCDLGNSSYPAPFQVTGGGDAVPDLCWRLHSVCLAGTFNSSNESLK